MSEKKLITAAKNFDIIAKVCNGIFRTVGIICAIFAVLLLIFGDKMLETGSFTLEMSYIKLYLSPEFLPSPDLIKIIVTILLLTLCMIFFMVSYGIKQFRGILAPMKEGRPFEANMSRKLKNIAWITLVGGCVLNAVFFIASLLLTQAYPMEQIFSSPAIEKVEFAYTADFNFIFVFSGIMFLSYIFDYGQKLQRESDETL